MEIFVLPLSFIAFATTLWITSFFARLMSAKKPDIIWIFAAWLLGAIFSIGIVVSLKFVIFDKQILVVLTYLTPLLVFTIIYRLFNQMNWLAAITINITVLSVGIIAIVIVIISIGKPLDKTIINMVCDVGIIEKIKPIKSLDQADKEDYKEETILTDKDLLAPQVIAALEKQQKRQQKSYIEPKFQTISIRQVNGAIGYKIRLAKKNGKVLEGILSKISNDQLIVKQNLYGGMATTPIAMESVKSLEVYW
jgi:hypothetical protein